MDFFRSILSDDPEPNPDEPETNSLSPKQKKDHRSDSDSDHDSSPRDEPNSNPSEPEEDSSPRDEPNSNPSEPEEGGGWSFEGFVRTFTTRSESVLETYRRDLEEFRSGLKKETELFREVASRAVKDLPSSIEVGASAAHGSLEAVGRTLDGVLKSTAEILSQGKESLLASSDIDSDTPDVHINRRSFDSLRYNRFEAQLRMIQTDRNTFCEDPDDLDDFSMWKLGFVLEDKNDEIKNLIEENGALEGVYKRYVPTEVDNATFWSRYFYRFHKLKQQEDVRANLVKRAISIDDDEELTWDVDDDDDDESNTKSSNNAFESKENKELSNPEHTGAVINEDKTVANLESTDIVKESSNGEPKTGMSSNGEPKTGMSKEVSTEDREKPNTACEKVQNSEGTETELVSNANEKVVLDKGETGKSSKDSDASMKQPSVTEEEEVGWDEIEDLGSLENKDRAEIRKRLSATEDDDLDLSWDIEDDEEPVNDKK